jgi:hypothetical protein
MSVPERTPDAVASMLLERLVANLLVAEAAMQEAAGEITVKGQKGSPAAHPGFGVAAKCDEVALRIAAELRHRGVPPPAGKPEGLDALDQLRARRGARGAGEGNGAAARRGGE